MTILHHSRDTQKDLEKVRRFSNIVEKKLGQLDEEKKIEKLTYEELQDFNKILQFADYLLCKYEERKVVHSLLKDFVDIVNNSSYSLGDLNDQIDELVMSAEDHTKNIKELQGSVSDNFVLNETQKRRPEPDEVDSKKNGSINLTKSSIPVYT